MSEAKEPLRRATEVFVHGFAFTRSITHPYLAMQVEPDIWGLRDAPRARVPMRGEEYVAYGVPPATLEEAARRHARGRYRICAIRAVGEPDIAIRGEFRARGYRLTTTEPLMTHNLGRIDPVPEPLPIVRLATSQQAQELAKAAGRRQILPEHLTASPAPVRQYMALDADVPVAWVGSAAAGGCAWVTNLFVVPAYRRRGLARALLTRMLRDDRGEGAQASILLASHTGAKLYPTVGYETIGELFMFTPRRETPAPR